MRVMVTGASGFVGKALCSALSLNAIPLTRVSRASDMLASVAVGDIDGATDWTLALERCTVVVHLAARVHVMNDTALDPLAAYRRTNVDGTIRLARHAAAAGVRRFIFISSVKVNGESTPKGRPFRADDAPAPQDPYGISKMEAEMGLHQVSVQTGLQVIIIRPPLVYGPGVGANFATLLRAVRRGLPLPLGAIQNQRSLVSLDNLIDLIITCLKHPAAANQTLLVSDGHDLSTAELVCGIASAAGVPARLPSVPVWVLRAVASLLGKRDVVNRLSSNLQVDISKTCGLLAWTPPHSVQEGLRRAVSR